MTNSIQKIILLVLFFTPITQQVFAQPSSKQVHTLIIFFDGLRPDYITADAMPNLYAFKQQHVYGNKHHSVFPTVTRLNSASYATGSYPYKHGIMSNTIFFPQISPNKTLNTGSADDLNKVRAATNNRLLTTVSLAEVLEAAGKDMMIFSSGSTGQALLQNHQIKGKGIINTDMILPQSLQQQVIKELGPAPKKGKQEERHIWATNALLKYGLKEDGPAVSAIWLSDPDGAAHSNGMGSSAAKKALKIVDTQFGRIIAELHARGLTDRFNIIISADHGFVTYIGTETLRDYLIRKGFKKDKESDDIVVADGAIYIKNKTPQLIENIVKELQQESWIGAIFTKAKKPGSMQGWVQGTLSFDAVHWNHPERAADILVDRNWNDSVNSAGYAGAGYSVGVAGHGGLSPYETTIPLIVSGPAFKKELVSEIPTSNIDIAPTVLALQGVPVPSSMDGRVMYELMKHPSKKEKYKKVKSNEYTTLAKYPGGVYKLLLKVTQYGQSRYIDYAKVKRSAN